MNPVFKGRRGRRGNSRSGRGGQGRSRGGGAEGSGGWTGGAVRNGSGPDSRIRAGRAGALPPPGGPGGPGGGDALPGVPGAAIRRKGGSGIGSGGRRDGGAPPDASRAAPRLSGCPTSRPAPAGEAWFRAEGAERVQERAGEGEEAAQGAVSSQGRRSGALEAGIPPSRGGRVNRSSIIRFTPTLAIMEAVLSNPCRRGRPVRLGGGASRGRSAGSSAGSACRGASGRRSGGRRGARPCQPR
jgi:hypothetical protein